MISFLSKWGSTNYEMAIENRFFDQRQFEQVSSQTLKSIIMADWGREGSYSSCGTSAKTCRRIHSELEIVVALDFEFRCNRDNFHIRFQVLSSIFFCSYLECFLTELVWLLAEGKKKRKKKKTQLEIAFIQKDIWPQRLYNQSTGSLPCSPCCASILSTLFLYSVCPPTTEPLPLSCPQAQSQIDMLNSQVEH